jgi:AcrR family transcriptional regulator
MAIAREETREKILLAALELFQERGIGKTSVNEIAYRAGVTRITVYRYFADKQDLTRAAFLRVEQVFQKGLSDLRQNPQQDWESILNQIGEDLSALPPGDVYARSDELKRLYPSVYHSIQEVRVATLNGIFDHLFSLAKQQDLLRAGLNRPIVQAIFWELIINFFDNPRFKSFGLSDAELYRTMGQIFLYGIFKEKAPASPSPHTPHEYETETQ